MTTSTAKPPRPRQPPTKPPTPSLDLAHIDASQLALTIEQAAKRLAIGRHLMYQLVMAGEIDSFKIGRYRRIAVSALEAYVRQHGESE